MGDTGQHHGQTNQHRLSGGHTHKANFVINRKHSLKNPATHAGKPRLKPKPAVLARWNIKDEEHASASTADDRVKAKAKLFEGRDNNNSNLKKPVISAKPKLLPKPAATKETVNNENSLLSAQETLSEKPSFATRPVAKPRKISAPVVQCVEDSSTQSAIETNPETGLNDSIKLDTNIPKSSENVSEIEASQGTFDIETSVPKHFKTNIGPRKLRGTFLRGIENALKGDSKPLDSFRRKSEAPEQGGEENNVVSSRWSRTEDDPAIRVKLEEGSEESGSDYDDVEILEAGNGDSSDSGWVDLGSTLTDQIPKPVAAPRKLKKQSNSDRGTRRRKVCSKERFKSDPDVLRASTVYDEAELHRKLTMSKPDGWETQSDDDGYEEVEDNTQFVRSSENISLPLATSPKTHSGILGKVKHKMGKTMGRAKNKFFSKSQTSMSDAVCNSPTNSASPLGSPRLLRGQEISPPIPEKGSPVTERIRSSASEPVLNKSPAKPVAKKRFSLADNILEDMPSYPAPPRPLSSFESFEKSGEEPLPPVPPRGASRDTDRVQAVHKRNNFALQSIQTEQSMARCESLEDIDGAEVRVSQVDDMYIATQHADSEDTYEDIDIPKRPTLRKQSTADSEMYIDWGEVESSNHLDRTTTTAEKDRAGSNASSNTSEPNYLEFDDDESLARMVSRKKRFQSRFMKFEPLYQDYTKGVIARSSWDKQPDNSVDIDDDAIYHDLSGSLERPVNEEPIEKRSSELSASSPSSAGIRPEFCAKTGTGMRTMWCEMPEVRDSGVLDNINPQEKKVQEAMFEVITSEASYLKSLNVLVDNFMFAPEFSSEHSMNCVLDRRSRHFLFSNLLAVRDVSERLLRDLEARWQECKDFVIEDVCDIVNKHASEGFECYIKYCSNQVYQDRTLNSLMKVQEFQEARLKLEANPECQGLNMTSFLLLPMQRITRLPLLIDAICHRLDPDKELVRYQSSMNALIELKQIVKQCNDGAKKMEQTEEMCLIDRQLVFKDPVKRIALISANRHLVKRGELTRISNDLTGRRPFAKAKATKQMVYLFLFTDLLLVTKKKSEELYSVIDYAKRSSLLVEPINDVTNEPRLKLGVPNKCEHLFILVLLENYDGKSTELILSCESPSDRARWMEAVMPPVQENPDEKIYESWDCPQVQAIHAYTAQQPDELTLEESDVVNVLRKIGDGWYEGENIRDGERGWFPSHLVEELPSAHARAKKLRDRWKVMTALGKLTDQTVKVTQRGGRKSSLF